VKGPELTTPIVLVQPPNARVQVFRGKTTFPLPESLVQVTVPEGEGPMPNMVALQVMTEPGAREDGKQPRTVTVDAFVTVSPAILVLAPLFGSPMYVSFTFATPAVSGVIFNKQLPDVRTQLVPLNWTDPAPLWDRVMFPVGVPNPNTLAEQMMLVLDPTTVTLGVQLTVIDVPLRAMTMPVEPTEGEFRGSPM